MGNGGNGAAQVQRVSTHCYHHCQSHPRPQLWLDHPSTHPVEVERAIQYQGATNDEGVEYITRRSRETLALSVLPFHEKFSRSRCSKLHWEKRTRIVWNIDRLTWRDFSKTALTFLDIAVLKHKMRNSILAWWLAREDICRTWVWKNVFYFQTTNHIYRIINQQFFIIPKLLTYNVFENRGVDQANFECMYTKWPSHYFKIDNKYKIWMKTNEFKSIIHFWFVCLVDRSNKTFQEIKRNES